ncbi:hypothetical protein C2S53_006907 [Perilla frutescens var. hirtella]|uniref:K Homology domain-containing protein n=1 Tax=Perilla frutescens var. hirtella TaxID=608512 RepID=A0AAD4PB87_PERFH|nr:hypothetical protein C2S53_006907 [Perilla frutescens var. hirtella]
MIACRSLFRVNFLLRETNFTYAKSKPLLDFQNCKSWHGFGRELNMDARNGIDRKKRRGVTQTWRAVSTQPDCSEGDGERVMLQNRVEEVHRATSTVSIAECEKSNAEVLDEPVNIDVSLDENLTPLKHSLSLEIGASLMRFIKGKGGGTQEKIQAETGVKITFPLSKKEDSIILEGNSTESITQASEKIQTIIDKAVNSRDLDYSHFVSLPLAIHPELVDKLVDFQNKILGIAADGKDKNLDNDTGEEISDEEEEEEENHSTASKVSVELKVEKADADVEINVNSDQRPTETPPVAEFKAVDADRHVRVNITNIPLVSYARKEAKAPSLTDLGIEKSIFIKPKTFHLTVLMLKLWNKERVKAATEVLQSVSSKVMDALENRPILIRLKGLDCMRGSKARARVLYVPVEEIGGEGRLLRACQVITDAFVDAGLVIGKDAEQQLKLHATLMNGRHRRRKERSRKMESFDARGIFELYGGEEWGEYAIREAHLSQRFVFDENDYYHCCASIPFPQNMQVD